MTTPTGTITAQDINIELSKSPTALMTLNDTDVRDLAGVPSGTISYDDLRGKSAIPGTLYGTYTLTLGDIIFSGTDIGFSGIYGDITPTTYRGYSIERLSLATSNNPDRLLFWVTTGGPNLPTDFVTAIRDVTAGEVLTTLTQGEGRKWSVDYEGGWDFSNVGETRTIEIYGN